MRCTELSAASRECISTDTPVTEARINQRAIAVA
jgi:hypothetical protein